MSITLDKSNTPTVLNKEDKTARDSWNRLISMLPDSSQKDFMSNIANMLESKEGRPLPFVKMYEQAIDPVYYEFPENLFDANWETPDTMGVGAPRLFNDIMAELSHAIESDIPLEDLKKQHEEQQAIDNILTHKGIVKDYGDLYKHEGTSEWAHQEEGEDVWFDFLQNYVYKDGNYPDLSVANKPKGETNWFGQYKAGQKYHEDLRKYKDFPKYKKQETKPSSKYSWKPKLNKESEEALYKSKSYVGNLLKNYKKGLKEGKKGKVDKFIQQRMLDLTGLGSLGSISGALMENEKVFKKSLKAMGTGLLGTLIQDGFMPYLDKYQIKGIDKLLNNIYGSNSKATNENVNMLPPIDIEAPQAKYVPETLLDSLRVLRSMHQYGKLKK